MPRNLRFGIFNCTNQMIVNNGNPKQTNYMGYAQYMNFCNPFGNQPFSTVATTNYDPALIVDALLSKSAELVSIGGAGGGNTNDPGFLDNDNYTLYLSVTENNPTNVSITTQFVGPNLNNGSISQTETDTNYCYTNFTSFVVRLGSGTGSAQNWNFTSFKVVTITPGAAVTPPVIAKNLAGSTLTLSWDPAYIGWTLQSQTNSSNVGLASNWATVAGSSTTNKVVVPMDLTQGSGLFPAD